MNHEMIGKLGYLISLCRQAAPISVEPPLPTPLLLSSSSSLSPSPSPCPSVARTRILQPHSTMNSIPFIIQSKWRELELWYFCVLTQTRDPAASAVLHAARSARRTRYNKWAGGSLSLIHTDGPLWVALLKTTVRCEASRRSLFLAPVVFYSWTSELDPL
jgi:hypothetical protein